MTNPLERFFTLASGIDHMESRSMLGVSIIKVYFQPGTNADADVTEISNLALADLKRLPPGTLPPVVLKFDASSLPVCLLTVKGPGLTETQLHDYAQFAIRNQIAVVKGAEIPPPFGGKYRQAMVYVDPYKLLSRQMTPMDVVHAVNRSNLILPAGNVKMGPYDYYVYSNSLVNRVKDLNDIPIKTALTALTALVHTPNELYFARFVLGAAEAGFFRCDRLSEPLVQARRSRESNQQFHGGNSPCRSSSARRSRAGFSATNGSPSRVGAGCSSWRDCRPYCWAWLRFFS